MFWHVSQKVMNGLASDNQFAYSNFDIKQIIFYIFINLLSKKILLPSKSFFFIYHYGRTVCDCRTLSDIRTVSDATGRLSLMVELSAMVELNFQ